MIFTANAVVYIETVMIMLVNAFITSCAMP